MFLRGGPWKVSGDSGGPAHSPTLIDQWSLAARVAEGQQGESGTWARGPHPQRCDARPLGSAPRGPNYG